MEYKHISVDKFIEELNSLPIIIYFDKSDIAIQKSKLLFNVCKRRFEIQEKDYIVRNSKINEYWTATEISHDPGAIYNEQFLNSYFEKHIQYPNSVFRVPATSNNLKHNKGLKWFAIVLDNGDVEVVDHQRANKYIVDMDHLIRLNKLRQII